MKVTADQYKAAKKLITDQQKAIAEQQKIINQWNKQQMVGKYRFLFYYKDSGERGEWRFYSARNINQACKKMSKYLSTRTARTLKYLDYEVDFNDTQIDISDIKCIERFLN